MDKMKMETANKTLENLAKLKEMFPEVITESKNENGEIVAAIDAQKLEQLLSTKVIEGDESYDFTWVGKKQAMVEANRPIRKTLRPCKDESVDWEKTENLYIEGDNLDVLKLLQESYLNKIKMIYIDPPYNTGNDSFIYPDDYKTNKDQYDEEVGAIDESGYRMFKNTETNGRFHSSWCSMMYPRLKLARNLLTDDGVIFISIDDNEVDNMRKICDEVFGESNFVGNLPRMTSAQRPSQEKYISITHDYLLIYAKNKTYDFYRVIKRDLDKVKEDSNGRYIEGDTSPILASATQGYSIGGDYDFEYNGKIYKPIDQSGNRRRWLWTKERMDEAAKLGILVETKNSLRVKNYINKEFQVGTNKLVNKDEKLILSSSDLINSKYVNNLGTSNINDLFSKRIFDFTKPIPLMVILLELMTKHNDIILDFFSGSATTAHAVMQLNAEDGGKRKFIMAQLPEVCDEKSEAYKAGYQNICEIGKERIRRAGKKIKEETGKQDLDIGFRVLKLDESNMKDVYFTPEEYKQTDLVDMVSNIKEDRTPEDLLYACMLEWGLELSLPHKVENIAGYNVHIVNDGDLIACFDNRISEEAIKQIADKKPLRAVFRDSSFASDAARVNVGEIFKLKSPNTTIKVI